MEKFFEELDALYQAGNVDRTEQFLKRYLEHCPREERITVLNELAGFYRGISRYEESEAASKEALQLLEENGMENSAQYATAMMNLAGTYRLSGRLDEAEGMMRQAAEMLDEEDYAYASTLNNLSLIYHKKGDIAKAEELAGAALTWMRSHGSPEHEVATSLNNLAAMKMSRGDWAGAAELLEEALTFYKAMPEPNIHYAAALSAKGVLCFRQGDLEGAEKAFERALLLTEHFFGHNAEYQSTLENLKKVREAREKRI
ncbi:MAG: hypothetical protein DBX46_03075 [Clostridiales bacterium]|nr:MAG: hypothetical protein DBX46_03075 [Clostridiales bacterium]